MNLTDPLGLEAFTSHIFNSIQTVAPYAAAALGAILVLYGVLRAAR
jgi:hypothetical protein